MGRLSVIGRLGLPLESWAPQSEGPTPPGVGRMTSGTSSPCLPAHPFERIAPASTWLVPGLSPEKIEQG